MLAVVVGGMVGPKRRSALEGTVVDNGVDAAEHLTDDEARANGSERTSLGVAFGLGKVSQSRSTARCQREVGSLQQRLQTGSSGWRSGQEARMLRQD